MNVIEVNDKAVANAGQRYKKHIQKWRYWWSKSEKTHVLYIQERVTVPNIQNLPYRCGLEDTLMKTYFSYMLKF